MPGAGNRASSSNFVAEREAPRRDRGHFPESASEAPTLSLLPHHRGFNVPQAGLFPETRQYQKPISLTLSPKSAKSGPPTLS